MRRPGKKKRRDEACRQLCLFASSEIPDLEELALRYDDLNRRHFGGRLPRPTFRLSRRMLSAGTVHMEEALLTISVPYHSRHGWGAELTGTLKHEMIHLCLHQRDRPSGHTREFLEECRRTGAPRYSRPLQRPYKYVYRCVNGHEIRTRKKISGHSCAKCAPQYHPRFLLRLARRLDKG